MQCDAMVFFIDDNNKIMVLFMICCATFKIGLVNMHLLHGFDEEGECTPIYIHQAQSECVMDAH